LEQFGTGTPLPILPTDASTDSKTLFANKIDDLPILANEFHMLISSFIVLSISVQIHTYTRSVFL